MDQRGTGRSEPRLSCAGLDSQTSQTASWADRLAEHRRMATACRAVFVAAGIDLDGYDTIENAADFVDLRRALGAEQMILTGASYAGRLEREIYRQDPASIAGIVFDSPLTTAPRGPDSRPSRRSGRSRRGRRLDPDRALRRAEPCVRRRA